MKKFLLLLFLMPQVDGTVLVQGNTQAALNPPNTAINVYNPNNNILTFSQPVIAKAFDRTNGVLYVGLANETAAGVFPATLAPAGFYTISKVVRANGSSTPIAIPIATNQTYFPTATPISVDFIRLATSTDDPAPVLVIIPNITPTGASGPGYLLTPNIIVSSTDGLTVQGYSGIQAYDPNLGENGPVSGGIVALEANQKFIFVAVRPPSNPAATPATPTDFGVATPTVSLPYTASAPFAPYTYGAYANYTFMPGSGIAVLGINPTTLLPTQVPAQPNDPGIKAAELDQTTPQVVIQGIPAFMPNRVALNWDDPLQRLYIGLQLATAVPGGGSLGDGAISVVVARVSTEGALTYQNFLPSTIGSLLTPGDQTKIVAATQIASAPLNLSAAHLKTMHTSGGGKYLILNGGNGTLTNNAAGAEFSTAACATCAAPETFDGTIGNMVFALPLVDLANPASPLQGVLADKSSFDPVLKRFTLPVTTIDGLTLSTDPAALVGAGPLPVQPSTPISGAGGGVFAGFSGLPVGADTMDLMVAGDTVYIALSNGQTSTLDDCGVFYSQAMYDETGKVASWTPWSKRSLPFDAFPKMSTENSEVRFIEMDPVTGKLWAVDGDYAQSVVTTGWDHGQFLSPLPNAVNIALGNECFSALDLDQSTTGLGAATPYRYALFGGNNTVAFAVTTQSLVPTPPFNSINVTNNIGDVSPAPQTVISNFSIPQNFLVTTLPSSQGASVNALEFSRQPTGTSSNYFFAGTDAGLYVFSNGANGFDVATLSTLNQPPLSSGTWQLVSNIPGSVVDIKTTGNSLYVLTTQTQKSASVSTLYSIPFAPTVASMFASPMVIAQSSVFQPGSDLSGTLQFYGIQIISVTPPRSVIPTTTTGFFDQIILATNNGLFMSNANTTIPNGGISAVPMNQALALWTPITPDNNQSKYFSGIAGIDTPIANTVWPFALEDPTNQGMFNRGSAFQLSGQTAGTAFGFDPVPFNASSNAPQFQTFDPITYFWSDGARRFFVVTPTGNDSVPRVGNRILSLPYNVTEWNVNAPIDLTDSILSTISKIYWIKNIGATGILMMGTDQGIIALE